MRYREAMKTVGYALLQDEALLAQWKLEIAIEVTAEYSRHVEKNEYFRQLMGKIQIEEVAMNAAENFINNHILKSLK